VVTVLSAKTPYEVFQRADSANWWMRFSLPGQGQIRLGLKTRDPDEAAKKAATEYQRAVFQAEHNLLPGKMSFDKVARRFLDSIEAPAEQKKAHATYVSHKGVIDRYLIPHFGKMPIAAITEPKLYAYIEWRRTFWTTGPGKSLKHIQYERGGRKLFTSARHEEPKLSTLRREAVTLRAVFNFAARSGFIGRGAIPKLSLEKEQTNKRPSFTNAEISTLLLTAEQRVKEMQRHTKLQYERLVLFCFVSIAVDTGMRPTELYNLTWASIVGFDEERTKPMDDRRIRIQAYGKGFQPRELVPNVGAFGAFIDLWEAYSELHGRPPEPKDPVFCNVDGGRLGSIKNSLNMLLEASKLKVDAFGRARTAYSFRHTYATNQIRKGTDVYTLAINMRTSVRMIETYYSDVLPSDLAKQLEGSYD
jgi:integrase